MRVLEIAGICVAALLALLFAIFLRRRLLMAGGGTIRLHVRVTTMVRGRGWSVGVGRFVGDELRFYRIFTFSIRPKLVLNRRTLTVGARRLPEGPERLNLPGDWVILACTTPTEPVEIAMAESTVTGFSSWLEAGPPGPPGTSRLIPRHHGGPAQSPTS
jgi:hypothetical protein